MSSVKPRLQPHDTQPCAFPPLPKGASLSRTDYRGQRGARENVSWAWAYSNCRISPSRLRFLTLDAILMCVKKPLTYFILTAREISLCEALVDLIPRERASSGSLCRTYLSGHKGLEISRDSVHFSSQANGGIEGLSGPPR